MIPPFNSETIYNLSQDLLRKGYQNLGSSSDTLLVQSDQVGDLFINGQGGNDRIFAFGQGNHTVHAGSGDDFVVGGQGNDTFYGGSGNDNLEGGIGFDQLFGGTGNDQLWGGAGADYLSGGSGDDVIMGDHDGSSTSQQGNDTLWGGSGRDTLSGGGGADEMRGGSGADTFRFDHINDLLVGASHDMIFDFSRAEGDKIDLRMIDANTQLAGDQAFRFATTEAQKQEAGRIWLGDVLPDGSQMVFLNINGGALDGQFLVKFNDATVTAGLQASDFFL